MKNQFEDNLKMSSIHDFSNSGNSGGTGGASGSGQGQTQFVTQVAQAPSGNDDDQLIKDLGLINYNELAKKNQFSEALFRDQQIIETISILNTKNKPNALLTGHAGVGKTQIVEEIARRLVNDDPIVSNILKGVTIYELPLAKVVSGASYVGQLEEKIYSVIDFMQDPKNKAVLFIDEIHQIMGDKSSTYDKLAQILKPALGRGHLRVIGATTSQEATTFMDDPAFSRRWRSVQVPELSVEQTTEILFNIRQSYQNHHKVVISDEVIHDVVAIGDEYKQYGSHRPDTAITLLDKAMSDTRIKRLELEEKAKTEPSLQVIIQNQPFPLVTAKQLKTSALTLLTGDNKLFKENVDQLKETLENNIIGQTEAKKAIINSIERLSLHLTKRTKPVSFLFAGPSGTGKTEIGKRVAEAIFGSKDRMVYINMSEYSNPASMTRIIGSSAGYVGSDSKRELPFDILENNPYQLVLLDEFEKAHPDVQRFFMQALDEGVVKTNRNKEIDFSRTIIIATTNAGVEEMTRKPLGFGASDEPVKRSSNEIINILRQSFDVELLNRFEHLIGFTSISEEDYTKILAVKYNNMIKEIQSNRKDLTFTPDSIDIDQATQNDVLKRLTEESYTPSLNGRPAERTLRKYIEDTLLANPNTPQINLL